MPVRENLQQVALMYVEMLSQDELVKSGEVLDEKSSEWLCEVIERKIEHHNGRLLRREKSGIRYIFESPVQATSCALDIQRKLNGQKSCLVRIGLHIGQVALERGVMRERGNQLAFEMGSAANAGGVFLSERVFVMIKNHPHIKARFLGSFYFSKGTAPYRVYALEDEGIAFPDAAHYSYLENKMKLVLEEGGRDRPIRAVKHSHLRGWTRLALVSIAVLGLIALVLRPWEPSQAISEGLTGQIPTIAVLPFTNGNKENTNDYFSDGVAEDILTLLAKIDGLLVISHSSVMQYKNTLKSNREVGEELKADHILHGSVVKKGKMVQVQAELVHSRTGSVVWSQTYDREVRDIFSIESEVAREIADALETDLTDESRRLLGEIPTGNIGAYELYLRGREYYLRYTDEDNIRAVALFRDAIQLDSTFALAWAGLGDAVGQHGVRFEHGQAFLDTAMTASKKAIALNPELSEGYKALGLAFHYQGKFEEAKVQYQKAIELNPSNDMATANLSSISIEQGDIVRGIFWGKKTLAVNPISGMTMSRVSQGYFMIGENEKGKYWAEKAIQIDPEYHGAYDLLGHQLILENDYAGARALFEQLFKLKPDESKSYEMMGNMELYEKNYAQAEWFYQKNDSIMQSKRNLMHETLKKENNINYLDLNRAYIRLETDRETEGREILSQFVKQAEKSFSLKKDKETVLIARFLSMAYAMLNLPDKSLDWMEVALEHGWMMMDIQKNIPFYENLKGKPRYQSLLLEQKQKAEQMRKELRDVVGEGVRIGEIILP